MIRIHTFHAVTIIEGIHKQGDTQTYYLHLALFVVQLNLSSLSSLE